MLSESRLFRRLIALLHLLFAIPLSIYLWLSVYVRFIADDWCLTLKIGQTGSVLQVLVNDYLYWFGRYTASLTTNIFVSAGLPWVQLWVPLVLASWYIGLAWLIAEIAILLRFRWQWRFGLLVALVIVPATLAGTPSLVQSVYWPNGLWVYITSILVLPYIAALILRASRLNWRGWRLFGALILTITMAAYAAGYTEPHTAVQLGMLLIALFSLVITKKRSYPAVVLLTAALITTIIASIIIIIAPGNTVRGGNFEQQPFIEAGINSVIHAIAIIGAATFGFSIWSALAAFIVPMMLAIYVVQDVPFTRRQLRVALILLLIVLVLLLAAYMLPGFVATSRPPPARSLIIPEFMWLITLSFLGIGLVMLRKRGSPGFKQHWMIPLLFIVGFVSLIGITWQAASYISPLAAHANAWDERNSYILNARSQGETHIVVPPLVVDTAAQTGLETLSNDPNFWMNRCAAQYYDVESITVEKGT